MLRAAVCLLLAGTTSAADPAADAKLVRLAKAQFAAVKTETLPNGLRVYLLPVPSSPVVSVMTAYKVGSADEDKDQTGLSHYLEHLLFKGTERLMPGDIDRATQRNGGANNAYTNTDMTVYHFDFAADRWEAALGIEADRMRNVRIDEKHEFQQEKGSVIAELKRNEDRPWDLESKAVLPLLFPKVAPYAHPVIGEEMHVRNVTAETIKRYYDKWYHPNNAALVVCGGFDADAAMAKIRTLFGPIPKGDLPPRKPVPAATIRQKTVRTDIPSKFDAPRMLMGFNGVPVGHADEFPLAVLEEVLASGKTSRLYRRMVEGERVAADVSADTTGGRYPGYVEVYVEQLPGKDRKATEDLVFAELKKLADEPVSPAELARVRRGVVAGFVFTNESVHLLAKFIAECVTQADVSYIDTYLDKFLAVTPADIQRVAKTYFTRESAAIVWSVPPVEKKLGRGPSSLFAPRKVNFSRSEERRKDKTGGTAFSLKDAKRTVLPNGLTLVTLENHRLPIVVAAVSIRDVFLREPADKAGVSALVGDLLEEGTDKHAGEEIATLIEDTGGSLAVGSSGGSMQMLTPDADLGFGLLFECLIRPTFPAEAFAAKKEQRLAAIADADTQPNVRARQAFNAAVYGDHPYGRPGGGRIPTVEKLTAADCKAFHAAAFAPDRAIVVVVGDIDPAAVAKQIEMLTAGWKRDDAPPPAPAKPPVADKPTEKIVSDPAASQTHVYVGHLGIVRTDPDYHALLVMDNVLGTGPGFTDRLSSTLRDRQGLAYTVNATITGSAGDQPGQFVGYIGTFPDKFTWVRAAFLKEVARIRDEPPTAVEVEDAKKYLLGSQPFRLTSNGAVAGELLDAERYGLGYDVLEKYRAAVSAVTPADVQAAAKKHLNPKALAVVAVGPIDKDGNPLPAAKGGDK